MTTENQEQLQAPSLTRGLGLLGAAVLLVGVAGGSLCRGAEVAAQEPVGRPLRVAINPQYPPLVFRQPEGTNGVEIDFAKALGAELHRPVRFLVMDRDELIPAVVEGQADIIMSGMSITPARQLRIGFSDPYLHSQLRAIFRQKDAAQFKTREDILKTTAKIGVIGGTTGDIFVAKNCPNAQRVMFTTRKDVPFLLIQGGRMDLYIDDTFALANMISENESELAYLQQPLSEEDLAWGIRQDDRVLLDAVNRALAKWKTDGTLDKVLDRWVPYLKRIKTN
jgi:polar amino acid transport system substrate-binding protein